MWKGEKVTGNCTCGAPLPKIASVRCDNFWGHKVVVEGSCGDCGAGFLALRPLEPTKPREKGLSTAYVAD